MRPYHLLVATLAGLVAAQETFTSTETTTETATAEPYSTEWVVTSTTTTITPSAPLAVSPTSSTFPVSFSCRAV
jgi:hypothetical protein